MVEVLDHRRKPGAGITTGVSQILERYAPQEKEQGGVFEANVLCVSAWSWDRLLAMVDARTSRAQVTTRRRRDAENQEIVDTHG
jgi:hypothetical protein